MTFYATQRNTGGSLASGTYNLSLSTTSKSVNALDLANLANNLGADDTQVFTGSLPALTPFPGTLRFDLSVPFSYDPIDGNLLLNVLGTGLSNTFIPFFPAVLDSNFGTAGGAFSRAMTPGCCLGFENTGLVTGFNEPPFVFVPVSEPATLALLGFALAGLSFARRKLH